VAGVVVERGALALVPHHDERRVAASRIAMQKPARITVRRRLEERLVDEVLPAAHDLGERALHVLTSRGVVGCGAHRLIEALISSCTRAEWGEMA